MAIIIPIRKKQEARAQIRMDLCFLASGQTSIIDVVTVSVRANYKSMFIHKLNSYHGIWLDEPFQTGSWWQTYVLTKCTTETWTLSELGFHHLDGYKFTQEKIINKYISTYISVGVLFCFHCIIYSNKK